MRIAITADLHYGHGPRGDRACEDLVDYLRADPPDVLLLGGDQGTANNFNDCLELFADLTCPKALVPGNHDLWVDDPDPRGDSLTVYNQHLPAVCREFGFHYLDAGPLMLPEEKLAIVGTINWYDYSWSLAQLQKEAADWETRLKKKLFTRGRHNDVRFVRWPTDDVGFTRTVVEQFATHMESACANVENMLVLTHHPACYGLNFPRDHPPSGWDSLLWDALSGNQTLENVLNKYTERIAMVFSGHTHRARENTLGPIRAWNVGGDYHFKRLLVVDWPARTVNVREFGDPVK